MDLSQELDQAVEASDVQRVTSLLKSNEVNLHAAENKHLLYLALTKYNTEIIELLIRAGADLNFIDQSFGTNDSILHLLIIEVENAPQQDGNNEFQDKYTRLAMLAIEHGADINALNDDEESVFVCAVKRNSLVIMRELSKRGARMDQESLVLSAWSAIHGPNAIEALRLIIGLNDPSTQVRSERALKATTLMLQSLDPYYNFDVFQELLTMIADLNQHDSNGQTLLYSAARFERVDAATVLLDRGVDVNKKTTQGELPLFVAAKLDNTAMTELLISRGANIHDRNDDGQYPVHGACSGRTADNLIHLLRRCASVNVKDNAGKYPIHIAASNDCFEIMLLLLISGSPTIVTDNEGNSSYSLCENITVSLICSIGCIMQCTLVQFTTGSENEILSTIIQTYPPLLKFYRQCCDELQLMKQTIVFENKTLLSLLVKNTSQLSVYFNNEEFAEAILNCFRENRANFRWYMIRLMIAIEIAKNKYLITTLMKNVLIRLFPFPIPALAIDKITYYLVYDHLVHLESDGYLFHYENSRESLISTINELMSENIEILA